MLIKVAAPAGRRSGDPQLTDIFRGRIVDVAPEMVIIEISGQERKIEAFIEMMRPFGIVELARTGRIAMARGKRNGTEESARREESSNLAERPRNRQEAVLVATPPDRRSPSIVA